MSAEIQPSLLGKLNERQVLRLLQAQGPLSRAEVARRLGLSAPTVSKAVASLLEDGLLEEAEEPISGRGRPAKKLSPARATVQVLGVVIDATQCQVVTAGLDGRLHEEFRHDFPTPTCYEELITTITGHARSLMAREGISTRGLGVSMPGLVDYRNHRGVLSPNLSITNGRSPAPDLAERLGIPAVMLQESHALCLAERHYGDARGLNNFAMLDVGTGIGLGVMSGGRLLTGHSGLAGEVGHITVNFDGRQCGCGNIGCLETEASDSALAWRVSQRLGRKVTIEETIKLASSIDLSKEFRQTIRYLAVGISAVINLFNPVRLFVHGQMFEAGAGWFEELIELVRQRSLAPSFADCQLVRARGCKRQGAIAGIIQHLTNALVPEIEIPLIPPKDSHSTEGHHDIPAASLACVNHALRSDLALSQRISG